MRGMTRRVLMTAAVTCAGAMAPAIAAAGPVVPKGEPFTVDVPGGELCAFPVRLSGVNGQTLHDSGHGVIFFSGPFTVTVAKLDANGGVLAAQTFNISGPTRVTFHADGSVTLELPGPQGFIGFINWGQLVVEISPDGVLTIIKQTGHAEDICAALS